MIKYREISGLIFLKNLLKELKQLLKIGVPIYGSQISYMGMGVTDTIVAGRASALDLSGLAIGNALSMPFYFLLGGCLFAETPIVAQLFGAKKYEEIGQKVREILFENKILIDLAKEAVQISESGLKKRARASSNGLYSNESLFLDSLKENIEKRKSSADELLKKYYGSWNKDLTKVFEEYSY